MCLSSDELVASGDGRRGGGPARCARPVTASLDRSYTLQQAPDAMRLLQKGETRGKVAITM